MICKSVIEFIDAYNDDVPYEDLSFSDESLYDELMDYCKENDDNSGGGFFL